MVAERLTTLEGALPPAVTPRMAPVSSIMGEILLIAIPIDPAKTTPMAVREYADWVLRPRLLSIPGVAQVIPIGGEVRQFQVQPDTRLMGSLDISLEQLKAALQGYAANTSGGFLELNGREYLIRHLGRTSRLEDLQNLAVTARNGQPILLRQIANVTFAPAIKRGDAGYDGGPAVILSVQKQPAADTVALTRTVEAALADMEKALPPGLAAPRVTFRQANFIEASINNLEVKLLAASVFVAAVLFLFLGNFRTTFISLTAIPVSVLTTALVFKYFGLSINTMTLGGIAIAIGELVDDAVVDVENILPPPQAGPGPPRSPEPGPPAEPGAGCQRRGALGGGHRHGHHRPGVRAPVRPAGHRGPPLRPPGHRLHRLHPRLPGGGGDPDPGAGLVPAAEDEAPARRRHPPGALAQGTLPDPAAAGPGPAPAGAGGHGGGGGCWPWRPFPSFPPPSCRLSTRAP